MDLSDKTTIYVNHFCGPEEQPPSSLLATGVLKPGSELKHREIVMKAFKSNLDKLLRTSSHANCKKALKRRMGASAATLGRLRAERDLPARSANALSTVALVSIDVLTSGP